MPQVFISIGSNIHPEENIRSALHSLRQALRILGLSTFYATVPWGPPGQPGFYNGVVEAATEQPPRDLKFQVLRRIETTLGRKRPADPYSPRPLDLDLLLYGNLVQHTTDLVLPDPEIAERPFLALPLYELAPDLILPDSGQPLREIAKAFMDHTMRPLSEYSAQLRKEILHE